MPMHAALPLPFSLSLVGFPLLSHPVLQVFSQYSYFEPERCFPLSSLLLADQKIKPNIQSVGYRYLNTCGYILLLNYIAV